MFLQTEGRALTSEEEREEKVYFRSVTGAVSDSVGIVAEVNQTSGIFETGASKDKPAPPTLMPSPLSSTGPAATDNYDDSTNTDDAAMALSTLSSTIYTSTRSYAAQPLDSLEELNNLIILTAGVTMKTAPTHSGVLERVRIMTDSATLSPADSVSKLPEGKSQEYTRVAITVTDDDDDSSEGSSDSVEEGHNSGRLPQQHLPKQTTAPDGDDMSVDSSGSSSSDSCNGGGGGRGLDFEGESSFTRLNITENNNNGDDDDGSSGGSGEEGGDVGTDEGSDKISDGDEAEDEEEDDFIVIPIRHSHDTPNTTTTAATSTSPDTALPIASAATDTPSIIPTVAPPCPTSAPTASADVTLPPIPPSTADIAEQQALLYKEQGNECIRNKQYTEAIGNYTMSIKFDPTLASAYNNRASVYITLKVYCLLYMGILIHTCMH